MPLRALDPEPSVSTSSTTSASVIPHNVTEGYGGCQIFFIDKDILCWI